MTDLCLFFSSLAVMAGVTYLVRMLPMVLLRRKVTSRFLLSFLYYMPYTVLAAMTIPAVFYSTGNLVTALAGIGVACVLAFRGKSLLTVAASASAAALLTSLVLLLFR